MSEPKKRALKFGFTDRVGKVWVVVAPTKHSILDDILYQQTIKGLMLQTLAGLDLSHIAGFYLNEGEARTRANLLLTKKEKSEL